MKLNLVIIVIIILQLFLLNVCGGAYDSKRSSHHKAKHFVYSSSLENESSEYNSNNNNEDAKKYELICDDARTKLIGGGELVKIKENRHCKNNYIGLKCHPRNKQYYYICEQNRIVLARCENSKEFNDTYKYCVTCEEPKYNFNVSECHKSGIFAVEGKPQFYYTCVYIGGRFIQKICKCPRGTRFDSKRETCIELIKNHAPNIKPDKYLESDEPCKPTIPVAQSSKHGSSLQNQPCTPGTYRVDDNSEYYYKCCLKSDGEYYQVKLKCPSGKSFDSLSEECTPNSDFDYFPKFPQYSIAKMIQHKKRNLLKSFPRLLTSHKRRESKRITLYDIFDYSEEKKRGNIDPILNTSFCGCKDVNKYATKIKSKDRIDAQKTKRITARTEYESGDVDLETRDESFDSGAERASSDKTGYKHYHRSKNGRRVDPIITTTIPPILITETTSNTISTTETTPLEYTLTGTKSRKDQAILNATPKFTTESETTASTTTTNESLSFEKLTNKTSQFSVNANPDTSDISTTTKEENNIDSTTTSLLSNSAAINVLTTISPYRTFTEATTFSYDNPTDTIIVPNPSNAINLTTMESNSMTHTIDKTEPAIAESKTILTTLKFSPVLNSVNSSATNDIKELNSKQTTTNPTDNIWPIALNPTSSFTTITPSISTNIEATFPTVREKSFSQEVTFAYDSTPSLLSTINQTESSTAMNIAEQSDTSKETSWVESSFEQTTTNEEESAIILTMNSVEENEIAAQEEELTSTVSKTNSNEAENSELFMTTSTEYNVTPTTMIDEVLTSFTPPTYSEDNITIKPTNQETLVQHTTRIIQMNTNKHTPEKGMSISDSKNLLSSNTGPPEKTTNIFKEIFSTENFSESVIARSEENNIRMSIPITTLTTPFDTSPRFTRSPTGSSITDTIIETKESRSFGGRNRPTPSKLVLKSIKRKIATTEKEPSSTSDATTTILLMKDDIAPETLIPKAEYSLTTPNMLISSTSSLFQHTISINQITTNNPTEKESVSLSTPTTESSETRPRQTGSTANLIETEMLTSITLAPPSTQTTTENIISISIPKPALSTPSNRFTTTVVDSTPNKTVQSEKRTLLEQQNTTLVFTKPLESSRREVAALDERLPSSISRTMLDNPNNSALFMIDDSTTIIPTESTDYSATPATKLDEEFTSFTSLTPSVKDIMVTNSIIQATGIQHTTPLNQIIINKPTPGKNISIPKIKLSHSIVLPYENPISQSLPLTTRLLDINSTANLIEAEILKSTTFMPPTTQTTAEDISSAFVPTETLLTQSDVSIFATSPIDPSIPNKTILTSTVSRQMSDGPAIPVLVEEVITAIPTTSSENGAKLATTPVEEFISYTSAPFAEDNVTTKPTFVSTLSINQHTVPINQMSTNNLTKEKRNLILIPTNPDSNTTSLEITKRAYIPNGIDTNPKFIETGIVKFTTLAPSTTQPKSGYIIPALGSTEISPADSTRVTTSSIGNNILNIKRAADKSSSMVERTMSDDAGISELIDESMMNISTTSTEYSTTPATTLAMEFALFRTLTTVKENMTTNQTTLVQQTTNINQPTAGTDKSINVTTTRQSDSRPDENTTKPYIFKNIDFTAKLFETEKTKSTTLTPFAIQSTTEDVTSASVATATMSTSQNTSRFMIGPNISNTIKLAEKSTSLETPVNAGSATLVLDTVSTTQKASTSKPYIIDRTAWTTTLPEIKRIPPTAISIILPTTNKMTTEDSSNRILASSTHRPEQPENRIVSTTTVSSLSDMSDLNTTANPLNVEITESTKITSRMKRTTYNTTNGNNFINSEQYTTSNIPTDLDNRKAVMEKLSIPKITSSEEIGLKIEPNREDNKDNISDSKLDNDLAIGTNTRSLKFADDESYYEDMESPSNHSTEMESEYKNGKVNEDNNATIKPPLAPENDDLKDLTDNNGNFENNRNNFNNKNDDNSVDNNQEVITTRSIRSINPEKQQFDKVFEFMSDEIPVASDIISKDKLDENKSERATRSENDTQLPEMTESEIIGNFKSQNIGNGNDAFVKTIEDQKKQDHVNRGIQFDVETIGNTNKISNDAPTSNYGDKNEKFNESDNQKLPEIIESSIIGRTESLKASHDAVEDESHENFNDVKLLPTSRTQNKSEPHILNGSFSNKSREIQNDKSNKRDTEIQHETSSSSSKREMSIGDNLNNSTNTIRDSPENESVDSKYNRSNDNDSEEKIRDTKSNQLNKSKRYTDSESSTSKINKTEDRMDLNLILEKTNANNQSILESSGAKNISTSIGKPEQHSDKNPNEIATKSSNDSPKVASIPLSAKLDVGNRSNIKIDHTDHCYNDNEKKHYIPSSPCTCDLESADTSNSKESDGCCLDFITSQYNR